MWPLCNYHTSSYSQACELDICHITSRAVSSLLIFVKWVHKYLLGLFIQFSWDWLRPVAFFFFLPHLKAQWQPMPISRRVFENGFVSWYTYNSAWDNSFFALMTGSLRCQDTTNGVRKLFRKGAAVSANNSSNAARIIVWECGRSTAFHHQKVQVVLAWERLLRHD